MLRGPELKETHHDDITEPKGGTRSVLWACSGLGKLIPGQRGGEGDWEEG